MPDTPTPFAFEAMPGPGVAGGLLVPGRNCWRVEEARRVAVVVDAENYFSAAKAAMRRARRSILLSAWDLDTRVHLEPQIRHHARPDRLGLFLNWLAATRPDLHIRVLKWDYADLFDLGRWQRPMFLRRWFTHRRLDYRLDGDHPTGACHHQKMLIIDDALAFCGGIDLTSNRWDTRAHRADDPVRRQPDGQPYDPFHDLMMAVDGDAARALGDLFRERWRRATGEEIAPAPPGYDPWPHNLVPLLTHQPVGIARTDPAGEDRPEVREVERLYLDAIASARRSIYLESQYFASKAVADALKERLAEPGGPEVVIINPVRTTSWLENTVMLTARNRLAGALQEVDRDGRFRMYAATTDGQCITVHAKVMIIDDRVLRIGSANLNNRSMGLDTECDLALEAPAAGLRAAETRAAIAGVRDDLLAEHLGTARETVTAAVQRTGSLIRTIETLRKPGGRTLEPLEITEPGAIAATVADAHLFDPERPVPAMELVGRIMPSIIPRERRLWAMLLGLAVVLGGLYALWTHTDLREWATLDTMLATVERVRGMAFGPLLLILLYVAAGFVAFPLLVLIAATAIILGPLEGFATALTGALASAVVLFWVGRSVGQRPLERLGGIRVRRVSRRLARSGILAVAAIRVVPMAPFTVVNLVAGASRIRFTDYVVGTVAGLLPGTLAFSLLGHQLERTLTNPTAGDMGMLAGLGVVAVGLGWVASRVLGRVQPSTGEEPGDRDSIRPRPR